MLKKGGKTAGAIIHASASGYLMVTVLVLIGPRFVSIENIVFFRFPALDFCD